MDIKPIKSDADHEAACERIYELMGATPDTVEGDELDILTTLVTAYEEEHFPIEAPDPIALIQFTMEQRGYSAKDFAHVIGTRQNRAYEILNKRRSLTMAMVRRVNHEWHIPAASLIQEYQLEAN